MPIRIPREDKQRMAEFLQQYCEEELAERIGNIAAEGLLDFVIGLVAPHVYNQAIQDARNVLRQQVERMDDELSVLEQPLTGRR